MTDTEDVVIPFIISVSILCTLFCICALRRCRQKSKKPRQQQQREQIPLSNIVIDMTPVECNQQPPPPSYTSLFGENPFINR